MNCFLVTLALMTHLQAGNIVPGPYPVAPQGFDQRVESVPHGKLEMVDYSSKTVGTVRHMMVYTPPGYSKKNHYPVLYLLHGIGGTEREWVDNGHPENILDNLYAQHRLTPMIVVFPNGRAETNDRPEGNIYAHTKAFENFEFDLINDVIPFITAHYPTKNDRLYRALAGLSMGGGQSLNFGLSHLDTFAWVGGFSSAPNTRKPEQLVADPKLARKQLKLLWVSCGNQDGLFKISEAVHQYLSSQDVPHIWQVDSGAHTFEVWKNDLYHFSQLIFK